VKTRRPAGAGTVVTLLLASLTACDPTETAPSITAPSITAPEVFYLRPVGDKSGPRDKAPFHVWAKDGAGSGTRTLTADVLPGSEAAVTLRRSGNCAGGPTHVTCEVGAAYDNWADLPGVSPTAAKGSKPGGKGTVRFTYTTKDGKKLTARTQVVVGEPVIEVLTPEFLKGVRPDAEMSEPIVVRNTGEAPVRGVGLEISANLMEFEQRYANCRYPDFYRGHIAVCTFPDLVIAPGETVVIRPTLRLRAPKTEMYPSFGSDAWALDMGPGQYGSYPKGGDQGDGPPLRAESTDALKGTYAKGGGRTYLVLDTHADYSVSDVDLYGDPGTKRTFKLTVRNNGPANAGSTAQLTFEPALGMTLVKQPMGEYDDDVYEPVCESNGFTYTCDVGELKPGETRSWEFTMGLGEPGNGALRLQDKGRAGEWDMGRQDANPDNDQAVIRVHPK
jgi:hypothetical protein